MISPTSTWALANIPAELQQLKQWVVWRYISRADGKYSKVPANALTGANASVTNSADWNHFATAVNTYNSIGGSGRWHGIGMAFCSAMSNYAGVDIDDAHGDENLLRAHRRVIQAFMPYGYCEYSPSGKGLHIIVKGRIEGRRKHGVEAYSDARFFTFTGHVWSDCPILECQGLLDELQSDLTPNRTVQAFLSSEPETADDETILRRMFAAKNGDKVRQLFNGVVLNPDGSPVARIDASSVDLALCNCIVWWTKNVEQAERILLRSMLGQRDKVQRRADYRLRTIRKAYDCHTAQQAASKGIDFAAMLARARTDAERAGQAGGHAHA